MKIYDADIRQILYKSFLYETDFVDSLDTVIIDELDVCAGVSRADIAVVNGKIHGYEIKSKQDNLDRLPRQVEFYGRVFDTMTIVTYESHLKNVRKIVPKWWGIKCVQEKKENVVLKEIRKPKVNKNLDIQNIAMLLWKDEMIDLLLTHSNLTRGLKNKSKYDLSCMIQQSVTADVVQEYVRGALKNRLNWKAVPLQPQGGDLHNRLPIV